LYRDAANAPQAAEAMRVTPADLLEMSVIDKIIKEPAGGAHNHPEEAAKILKETLGQEISDLVKITPEKLIKLRVQKFGKMGVWVE
jgi:acetyl-CoA carboxylase carboxyl transferase subunit alpha